MSSKPFSRLTSVRGRTRVRIVLRFLRRRVGRTLVGSFEIERLSDVVRRSVDASRASELTGGVGSVLYTKGWAAPEADELVELAAGAGFVADAVLDTVEIGSTLTSTSGPIVSPIGARDATGLL
jgi:hypothetical protein